MFLNFEKSEFFIDKIRKNKELIEIKISGNAGPVTSAKGTNKTIYLIEFCNNEFIIYFFLNNLNTKR